MVVLVCGGRDFADYGPLSFALDAVHRIEPITRIVSGAARGADALGEYWAHTNRVPVVRYPADWTRYRHQAGPIRNAEMLKRERVDLVVACPGGRGTADMVRRALAAHLTVMHIE